MLIAFTGLKRSGKDTAAEILLNKCPWLERVRFADPLKNMLRSLMNSRGAPHSLIEEYIEGKLKEDPNPYLSGATTRWAMQSLGTEWGRVLIHDNFWIHAAEDTVKALTRNHKTAVFTDVRFPNEVDFVRRNNGILIKISRPGYEEPASHESEIYIKQIQGNVNIINNGTIEQLEQTLLRELHEWL